MYRGYYGTCAECRKRFATAEAYDAHPCMKIALAMSHEELTARLIAAGKLSPKYAAKK